LGSLILYLVTKDERVDFGLFVVFFLGDDDTAIGGDETATGGDEAVDSGVVSCVILEDFVFISAQIASILDFLLDSLSKGF
jgi:hypothetical protein